MSKDKESICVTVRVRPLSNKELDEDSRICLRVDESLNLISINGPQKEAKDFYFDSVCDAITQNQMFERVGKRSTVYCMEGYNCTIFAYGQTGAGKTYTMMGVNPQSRDYFQQRGLVPRTLQHLFQCIEKQITESGVDYIIRCSFVQIYNEQIIDLLGTSNNTLNIRQDLKKGVYIEGVTQEIISQSQEAMQILRKGSKGRHVGSTFYNQTSSRSHSVFTMQIQSQQLSNGIKSTKSRHFHFIDLAGSQRTKKSMGDRLKEGCSINKSLHVLSMVISSLAQVSQGKTRHVNYRDSKLTFLLKDSLGGNSKTHLIANISPSFISSLETKSTLMFARKVKLIKVNKVSINEDASGNLESLKAQIRRLRSQNILLRNGNTLLPPTMTQQNSSSSNNNTKMVGVLQQYVDEQIQKQTKMQLQITKLQNKNSYLQKGIKHFSQNERQLRMVLAIYEDKIKKLKKAQSLMIQKLQQINGGEKIQEIKKYFHEQRQVLLDQIERYKQLSTSSALVKNLLRQLKVIKQNPQTIKEQGQLIAVLTKNNQFLQQIKSSITQLQPQMQQGKASKAVLQQNQQLKAKNQQLSDQIQKCGLQLTEAKDKMEQTENLLSEAISAQIIFEKKIEQQQLIHKQALQQNTVEMNQLRQYLQKAQQKIKSQISKQNQMELLISQYQLQISQTKSQLLRFKEKKDSQESVFQQRIQILTSENQKMEQIIRKKIQQYQKLKAQTFQIKSQSERIKEQTSVILGDASTRLQQLQQQISRSESQKLQIRSKFERENTQFQGKVNQMNKQKQRLSTKLSELSNQLKNYQQQIIKQQQEVLLWKQKYQQIIRSQQQQRLKWQENNGQLIRIINQKKACDSDTQAKLTQSQLQIISLNEKLAQVNIQYKKATENLKTIQSSFLTKSNQLQQQLSDKQLLLQQVKNQNTDIKRKMQILTQIQHSLKRQTKNLQDQNSYNEQQKQKLAQQIQKLKKKQKQGRLLINQLKNQMYALKKNYELQIETVKQQLRTKEDEVCTLVNQNNNLKESNEKSLIQIQRKMESQFQIFKQNEGSIKRAMQTHLSNKQKKINQLKTLCESQQQQIRQKTVLLADYQKRFEQTIEKLNKQISLRQLIQKEKNETEMTLSRCQQTMNTLQSDHLKAVEEMENRFNQECDIKNAEIDRLRRRNQQNQPKIARLPLLQEQTNQLKSQLINRQAYCQQLLNVKQVLIRDLQAIRNNGQQANNYAIELQAQLKERQTYILQLNQNFKMIEEGLNVQLQQKQSILQKLDSALHTSQLQIQNLHRLNQKIANQKNQIVSRSEKTLSLKNQQFDKVLGDTRQLQRQNQGLKQNLYQMQQQLSRRLEHIKSIQRQMSMNVQKEQQISKFLSQSLIIKQEPTQPDISLFARIHQLVSAVNRLENEKNNIQNTLHQISSANISMSQQNRRLIQILREIQHQNQVKNHQNHQNIQTFNHQLSVQSKKNEALSNQLKQLSEKNLNLQRQINQFKILVERKHKQIENLQQHLGSVQKKAQNQQNLLNQRIHHMHQQSSSQINRLNDLYEKSKQKLEVMRNDYEKLKQNEYQAKGNYQAKIQQLQNQIYHGKELVSQAENDVNNQRQKNQELQKYIDQLGFKVNGLQQQKEKLIEQLQEIKIDSQKRLKQSQKRCQLGAAQMNSLRQQIKLIQDEASVWKQRMQNLQSQIRVANDRSQKFRVQYMKQKESNKQFKLLLDNAHCQIQSFRNEVMDKDKLYHQLLQKVSKNDIQRKGLINQDKKFSDLLQKSRIQVSQIRKKYDDQLKINNLLKQQIEKKEVDLSVVRQKSEQYCRKHQQLIQSIKNDYSKVESELKTTQNSLAQSKKSLKKVTLKNEQLEDQLQRLNNDFVNVQKHNDELKKQSLRSGADQRQIGYVNKLKQQNTQLKRQLDKVSEQIISINQQKLRLKSQIRYGKESDMTNLELSKKNSEVKYLQKIIDDSVNVLGIRDYKKSVGQSLKTGILDLQRELAKSRSELNQLTEEISLKNQRIQILQNQKFKNISTLCSKQEQDTLTKMRNKIGRVTSNFESIRQSKEQQKPILQTKDPNKSNLWGHRN